jgi:hypothetical protein
MIVKQLVWSMAIVGLPDADVIKTMTISKLDYTIPYADCQTEKQKSTMEYNYITNEELLENNTKKYHTIIP